MTEISSEFTPDRSSDRSSSMPTIKEMYKDYFLDYASYVILERAVPHIDDGLKPVQRRILYSMFEKEDGRYHKVANLIGHTMQYHPHGDAAIGDAMVKIGQKEMMIDSQGNWGDVRTGDSAAAARYIEARLTPFAVEVGFNNQTTLWQLSYDGRNKEPIALPIKFPILLQQGVEGIAVGLSTKILPHNFIELIEASIKVLQGKPFIIYPDFQTSGKIDISDYNKGKRGGKVKIRANIETKNKSTLLITELPYGITTNSLIDSIIKANDKGKIKIKKVVDNTAKDVEIEIELASGVSPEVTSDALYAFTSCEISVSPNACVIVDQNPMFLTVNEILVHSVHRTKNLLGRELMIKKGELENKLHFANLEKIFIEHRIYRDIEEAESYEEALDIILVELKKYIAVPSEVQPQDNRIPLVREITKDDLMKLTEIRIKRISKYNTFKHDEQINKLEEDLVDVNYHLKHLTDFTIEYYRNLLSKYGKGKERRTEIQEFDAIRVRHVVANNAKLYASYKEGFIGTAIKKDDFIKDCSDIDNIIAFTKSGQFKVVRIDEKVFIEKNLIYVDVWRKGDERTTYNMLYKDGKTGITRAKRFHVKAVTFDRFYDLTKGSKGSEMLYFTCNPNGESEKIKIFLSSNSRAKNKVLEYDFGTLDIKGRSSNGNIVTKYEVKKVVQEEIGKSSLGAQKLWMDEVSGRLNKDERGKYLGAYDTGDYLIAIYQSGHYLLKDPVLEDKIDLSGLLLIDKFRDGDIISLIHWEGERNWSMIKRFEPDVTKLDRDIQIASEAKGSKIIFATIHPHPIIKYSYQVKKETFSESVDMAAFIDVKGWQAIGNKLCEVKIRNVQLISKINTEKIDHNVAGDINENKKEDDEGYNLTLDF